MGGYRKQCSQCRRTFTHPPAFTIHRKSCGNEGAAPTPRRVPASPRSQVSATVNPLSFPAKPPPATERQRRLAAQEELTISLEMEQAAYARDLAALSPKPQHRLTVPPEVPEMVLDPDAEMARQLQRELNGFRGRSPRQQSFAAPPRQDKSQWQDNPAATTLVGRSVCRRAGGKTMTVGAVTERVLRDDSLKYQVTYTDGRVEELEFERLRPMLEPTTKTSSSFMSMPGLDGEGGEGIEPEEPKEIRVGEDYQCGPIPVMLTTPPAGAELATVGQLVWDPTSIAVEALSSYLSAADDQLAEGAQGAPALPGSADGGTPPTSPAGEQWRKQPAASEHLLEHLHSYAYNVAAATASVASVEQVELATKAPRLIDPMRRVFEEAVEKHGKDFRQISQIMNAAAKKSVKRANDNRTAEVQEVLGAIVNQVVDAGEEEEEEEEEEVKKQEEQASATGGDDDEQEAAPETTEPSEPLSEQPERQLGELRVGDIVDVDRLVAVGEGGRASILSQDDAGFAVKYVVGTKEKDLPASALTLCTGGSAEAADGSSEEDMFTPADKTPDQSADEAESSSDDGAPTPAPGGSWTTEEDNKLIELIKQHGEVDWPQRATDLGTGRSAKACQTRYRNHLRNTPREPKMQDHGFTGDEVENVTVAGLTLWYYTVWKLTPQYNAWHERWSDRNNSECEICDRGGRLLCCGDCPASYHPRCCEIKYESWDAAMAEIGDKGSWQCPACRPGPRLTRAQLTQATTTTSLSSPAAAPLSLQPQPGQLDTTSQLSGGGASRIPRSPPITPASVPIRPVMPTASPCSGGVKRPASYSNAPPAKKRPLGVEMTPIMTPGRPEAAPKWSPEEDDWLLQSVAEGGIGNWALKAEEHASPGMRSASSVGHRWQKLLVLEPERTAEAMRLAGQRGIVQGPPVWPTSASSMSSSGARSLSSLSSSLFPGMPTSLASSDHHGPTHMDLDASGSSSDDGAHRTERDDMRMDEPMPAAKHAAHGSMSLSNVPAALSNGGVVAADGLQLLLQLSNFQA